MINEMKDRPLYASISGGKDSTALGLWLKENGLKFTPIFFDTGWEHEETYRYIEETLSPIFGEFLYLRNESLFPGDELWAGGMEQAILKNRIFPSGAAKFCTRLLKLKPLREFMNNERLRLKEKPVNIVGVRAQESAKRAALSEIEEQDEATVWRPLISWTEADVIEMHHKHKISPNPLYLRGASRVGCFPCIYARKHEIRHLSLAHPERIKRIEELERMVNELREEDAKKATFFKSRRSDREPMGIREIVEWSKDKTGDDLEDIEDTGCMRWGLCEHPSAQSETRRLRGVKQRRLDLN